MKLKVGTCGSHLSHLQKRSRVLFFLSIIVLGSLALVWGIGGYNWAEPPSRWFEFIQSIGILLLAASGLMRAYASVAGLEADQQDYKRSELLFEKALNVKDCREKEACAGDRWDARIKEVIRETGIEALQENARWFARHADARPSELAGAPH